jgi:hypothetical protein
VSCHNGETNDLLSLLVMVGGVSVDDEFFDSLTWRTSLKGLLYSFFLADRNLVGWVEGLADVERAPTYEL